MPRPLRSTGVTPLQRYYGPLRLPDRAACAVIGSRSTSPMVLFPSAALPGLPGSWAIPLTDAPPPYTPESPAAAHDHCFAADAGFATFGRLATLIKDLSRPVWVRLRCGSSVRLPRLQTAGCPAACSVGFMSNDQFTWQSPFILQGMRRLFLAHQSDQSKNGRMRKRDGRPAVAGAQKGLRDRRHGKSEGRAKAFLGLDHTESR